MMNNRRTTTKQPSNPYACLDDTPTQTVPVAVEPPRPRRKGRHGNYDPFRSAKKILTVLPKDEVPTAFDHLDTIFDGSRIKPIETLTDPEDWETHCLEKMTRLGGDQGTVLGELEPDISQLEDHQILLPEPLLMTISNDKTNQKMHFPIIKTLQEFRKALVVAAQKLAENSQRHRATEIVQALRDGMFVTDADIKKAVQGYNELGLKIKFWHSRLGPNGCGVKIVAGQANIVNMNVADPAETLDFIAHSVAVGPEMVLTSPEMLAGMIPTILNCFAGNLFPSFVIGVGYSPTIVCSRDKDGKRVFTEGQRILIYLDSSTKETFSRFCEFFIQFFGQPCDTIFGPDYLPNLLIRYRPKFC